MTIPYKFLNRETFANYKLVFQAINYRSLCCGKEWEEKFWWTCQSKIWVTRCSYNPTVSEGTTQRHAWWVCGDDTVAGKSCFFSCETWHVSTRSIPDSPAFVWKNLDQISNLRFIWLRCQQTHLYNKPLPLMVPNFFVNS